MITLNTKSSERSALDVVLCMALTIKFNGPDPDALRQTAKSLAKRAPYEHRPKLKKLATITSDGKVLDCAWHMLDNTWEMLGHGAQEAPRCHMKPMRLAGRAWYCQHCSHVKLRAL